MEKEMEKENIDENQSSKQISLQEKFQQFRKERQSKIKNAQYLKQQKIQERKCQDFKDNLRIKFIEQCKKYFGVPYHKKYWNEQEEHYNAPLYLDCCGLIRQVIYDLREDFGFSLARWNQAYQFDICPKEIEFKDMKPGDLIFISATYYNKNLKPFAHNMVHVEVYTGGETGEQTIGARYQRGVVQYHDSYKFVSKNYYDMKYYFRSLDTWLDGICQSHCPDHEWRDDRDLWVPDKYSIFLNEQNQECEAVEEIEKEKAINQIKKIYVGKGNNSELIESYFKQRNLENRNKEFQILDKNKTFQPFFYFKWVQTTSEIDFLSFKEGEQIVNHISNIKLFTSKVGLLTLLREYQMLSGKQIDFYPETYQLDYLSDEILFLNKQIEKNDQKKEIWIMKPHNSNMGKGIQIINDIYTFKKNLIQQKKHKLGSYTANFITNEIQEILNNYDTLDSENHKYPSILPQSIIQKYIQDPLLINQKKFDIRCYALIACTKPLLLLFHHGYARLSLLDYQLENEEDPQNKYIHLTNAAIQKQHKNYKQNKEDTIWSMEQLQEYLLKQDSFDQERIQKMYQEMKNIIKDVIQIGYPKLDHKIGQYELLGIDILIDNNLKPYLLEINTNPALFTDTQKQKEIIPKVMNKTLEIILKIYENTSQVENKCKQIQQIVDLEEYEILIQ